MVPEKGSNNLEPICLHSFWLFIFLKMVKMFILPNTYSHFNTFKIVNLSTVKNHFKFFYFTKYNFNFKSNYFKCLHPKMHSHFNTFKMVNSFCQFQIGMGKMATMTVNKQTTTFSSFSTTRNVIH